MEDKSPAAACFTNFNELTKCNDWNINVYRTVQGGGTGQEYPENLKMDGSSPGNKWYDCWSGETWIEAQFYSPTRVKFMQLKAANDCPERDPYHVSVGVKHKNETEFKTIGNFDCLNFMDRYQVLYFNIDTNDEVSVFRVTIHKNKSFAEDGQWASGTQLAQLILYK